MSVTSLAAGVLPHLRMAGVKDTPEDGSITLDLRVGELWRAHGDHRWRAIICQKGVVWITQERDLHDYVLSAGEMFLVTLPGRVMIQGLQDASIQITPSLRAIPYVGDFVTFP